MANRNREAKRISRKGSAKVAGKGSAALDKKLVKLLDDVAIAAKAEKVTSTQRDAELKADQDRREHPLKHLNDEDIHAVHRSLHEAAYGLLSIHRLSIDAGDNPSGEFYLVAITQLARSAFRMLDACMGRLQSTEFGIGNFATEFDFE